MVVHRNAKLGLAGRYALVRSDWVTSRTRGASAPTARGSSRQQAGSSRRGEKIACIHAKNSALRRRFEGFSMGLLPDQRWVQLIGLERHDLQPESRWRSLLRPGTFGSPRLGRHGARP